MTHTTETGDVLLIPVQRHLLRQTGVWKAAPSARLDPATFSERLARLRRVYRETELKQYPTFLVFTTACMLLFAVATFVFGVLFVTLYTYLVLGLVFLGVAVLSCGTAVASHLIYQRVRRTINQDNVPVLRAQRRRVLQTLAEMSKSDAVGARLKWEWVSASPGKGEAEQECIRITSF